MGLPDRKKIFSLLFVLSVTFLVFAPSLENGFTNWDDDVHLTQNRLVRSLDPGHIRHIFTTVVNLTYIPLTTLTFTLENHFFGLDPFIYHLDNLLLHLAVTALVFVFAIRMGVSLQAATAAALIFAIHPMRVESVVWVTERKDVLYGFFYMLALTEYLSYLRRRNLVIYFRVLLWGLLSVLSKSMAVTLPLALLLCDWFYGRRDWKRAVLEKAPFFFVMTPVTCVTYALNTSILVPHEDLLKAVLILAKTTTFYIEKFFFPFVLVPNYGLPQPVSLGRPEYILSLFLCGLAASCFVRQRKDRWFVFALVFYVATIFVILRTNDHYFKGVLADRYSYIPSVGLCLFLGVAWDRYRQKWMLGGFHRRWLYLFLTVLILVALGWKTYSQSLIWKDSLTLWNYVVKHAPERAFIYNNRGTAYLNLQQYGPALEDFNKALAIDPEYDDAFYNRGQIYKTQGRYDLAMADFNKAIAISPNFADAYNGLGSVYEEMGQLDRAMGFYNKAITVDPNLDKAYNNRGAVHLLNGRSDLALADFNRALSIYPGMVNALNNRGTLYRIAKEYDLALADFNAALAAGPNARAFFNRAVVYGYKDRFDLALQDFSRVLSLEPGNVLAWSYRGIIFFSQGQFQQSVDDFTHVTVLDPDNYQAYWYRMKAYGRLKDDARAIEDLNQMIRLKPKVGRNYFNRSVCYRNLGDYEKSYQDLIRSARLGYRPPPAYTNSLKRLLGVQ